MVREKLKKRAVGRPFLLRETDEVYHERWTMICDMVTVLPGIETVLGKQGQGTLRWWANPQREDWGKVVLYVNLNNDIGPTLESIRAEMSRMHWPPADWDHWKEFGIAPTLDRETVLSRFQSLPATKERDVAYGRILSELWSKGAYRGQKR